MYFMKLKYSFKFLKLIIHIIDYKINIYESKNKNINLIKMFQHHQWIQSVIKFDFDHNEHIKVNLGTAYCH